jgi:uncharacterized protein
MRPSVLVDSGPLIALFFKRDRWHQTALTWLREHTETPLITTWPVLTEVCALLAVREACERYADLPLDPADAAIAEAAQRLGITEVLSIDADFDIYRDVCGKPLKNLLRAR